MYGRRSKKYFNKDYYCSGRKCSFVTTNSDRLRLHEYTCEFNIVQCTNNSNGCTFTGIPHQQASHNLDCTYVFACRSNHCRSLYMVKKHQEACPYFKTKCINHLRGCRAFHNSVEMLQHIVNCSFHPCDSFNCSFKGTRTDLEEHKKDCLYLFLDCSLCGAVYRKINNHRCDFRCFLCDEFLDDEEIQQHIVDCLEEYKNMFFRQQQMLRSNTINNIDIDQDKVVRLLKIIPENTFDEWDVKYALKGSYLSSKLENLIL